MPTNSTTFALNIGSCALITLFAAACGSNPEQSAAPAPPAANAPAPTAARDACTLITEEEAAQILGSPARLTPRSASATRTACDYITEKYETFSLEVIWSGAEDDIKTARAAAPAATAAAGGAQDKVVNEAMGLSRVDKLGDEAYFSRRALSYVRKGDVLLVFQNAGLNDRAREQWEALARAALARL